MKIGIVLQARMGSTRLPGKVILSMAGKPMIQWCVEGLRKMRLAQDLVVATSTRTEEEPLVRVLGKLGVPVFRGDELDVLDRYYQCAKNYGFDHVIRATGDNPLVDPILGDALIELHLAEGADYSSSFPEFGSELPTGIGLEIFKMSALERSWREGKLPAHREHVNEYIYENPSQFKVSVLKGRAGSYSGSDSRLTVDDPSDFRKVEALIQGGFRG